MIASVLALVCAASAQSPSSQQSPPVKINVLNVCTPTQQEQQELKSVLARLPQSPSFASDFEISRGVSTLPNSKSARYVRLRRDFKADSALSTVQYSLSTDPETTVETLVFRGRDAKDLLQLSIEDKLSTSVSKPAVVVESDTPASRVRFERLGKTTLALARCLDVDQSPYELIFSQASALLAAYRHRLQLRSMLANDLLWLGSADSSHAPVTSAGSKGALNHSPVQKRQTAPR